LTPALADGTVPIMGSILIRQIPDPIHLGFKKLCQRKQTSMEKEMIRLIQREVLKGSKKK
jgi:hypothetical protein